jgi:hypothetical protein
MREGAREIAHERLAEITLGRHRPKSIAWDDAVAQYLDDCAQQNRSRTVASYRRLLDRHFPFGRTRLADITYDDISRKIGRASTASMARSRCFCLGSVNHSPFNLRRRLAKIVQGPLAEQVRVALAGFRKLNDLTGDHCDDEIVSIRKSEGGACHLECDAHDPPGLGVEVLAV